MLPSGRQISLALLDLSLHYLLLLSSRVDERFLGLAAKLQLPDFQFRRSIWKQRQQSLMIVLQFRQLRLVHRNIGR